MTSLYPFSKPSITYFEPIDEKTINIFKDVDFEKNHLDFTLSEIKFNDIWDVIILNKEQTKGIFTNIYVIKQTFQNENPLIEQLIHCVRIKHDHTWINVIFCDYIDEISKVIPVHWGQIDWDESSITPEMNKFLHYINAHKYIVFGFLDTLEKKRTNTRYFGFLSQFDQNILKLNYKTINYSYGRCFIKHVACNIIRLIQMRTILDISCFLSCGGELTAEMCRFMYDKIKNHNNDFGFVLKESLEVCLKTVIDEYTDNPNLKKYYSVISLVGLMKFADRTDYKQLSSLSQCLNQRKK
jgi:hypothetical protein